MLFKQKVEEKKYINPRFRAYGKARLDIARRAKTRHDWEKLWKSSTNPFPFTWGKSWKHCVEYKVDDFAAEVGFFVDILGLPVNAFDPSYAMFTSPGGDFFIGIVPTPEKTDSTPQDAIRLQFMVADIIATTKELEQRGVIFEQLPVACQSGSSLYIGYFRTPHGIPVDLWGHIGHEEDHNDLDLEDESDEDDKDPHFDFSLRDDSEVEIIDSDEDNRDAQGDDEDQDQFEEMIEDSDQKQEEIKNEPHDDEEPGYETIYEEEPPRNWPIN